MLRFINRCCLIFEIFPDVDALSLGIESIRATVAGLIVCFQVSRRQTWQERQNNVLRLISEKGKKGNKSDISYQVQGNIFGTLECNGTYLSSSRGISRGHTSTSHSRKDSGTLLGPKGKQTNLIQDLLFNFCKKEILHTQIYRMFK